jgi:hypothetical protein
MEGNENRRGIRRIIEIRSIYAEGVAFQSPGSAELGEGAPWVTIEFETKPQPSDPKVRFIASWVTIEIETKPQRGFTIGGTQHAAIPRPNLRPHCFLNERP